MLFGDTPYSSGSSVDTAGWYYDNNVWEWCWDWYGDYSSGDQTDPIGAASGTDRVLRGGSWFISTARLRSALRIIYAPMIRYDILGFRVVRPCVLFNAGQR